MYYRYQRAYSGPVEAVIFGWTGTLVDYGARAPVAAFSQLFREEGIELTDEEIRSDQLSLPDVPPPLSTGPVPAPEYGQLLMLLQQPRVRDAWQRRHGGAPTEADLQRLHRSLIPLLIEAIDQRTQLIPGALPTLHYLESRGIAFGSNTDYSRDMIARLFERVDEQGCPAHSTVCASDVRAGSPWPQMTLKNLLELEVKHLAACIRVDDSLPGIEDGLNAGLWTVAVALTGHAVGLDLSTWNRLDDERRARLREHAYSQLNRSGAHYVIDSVADLPRVIEDIEERLADGERP